MNDPLKLADLKPMIESVLHENILNFWMNHSMDHLSGGFYGQLDNKGIPETKAHKGSILVSRILWAFSAAYNSTGNHQYLILAENAYQYIRKFMIDKDFGGVYWLLDYRGEPVDSGKKMDSQAYAIYGLSEYYRASGVQGALNLAMSIYEKLEFEARDWMYEGYFDELGRDWKPMKPSARLKTFNTHLHILEAYTNLNQVVKSPSIEHALEVLCSLVEKRFYLPNTASFQMCFSEKFVPMSDNALYGINIEGAWLLNRAGLSLTQPVSYSRILMDVARSNMEHYTDTDGGLFYEGRNGIITDRTKHWWPQAEAAIGFLHAWLLTKNPDFLHVYIQTWEFINTRLVDKENGEWFHHVSADGEADQSEPKASLWKCPYHNVRACLESLSALKNNN